MRSSAHVSESEHVGAVEFSQRERPPAERIAHRDQLALAHDDERERAFDPAQRPQDAAAVIRGLREADAK